MRYRWWLILAAVLLAIGIAAGILTPVWATVPAVLQATFEVYGSTLAPYSILTVLAIFIKNAIAIVISFALSPLLCLVPLAALLVNGWLIGFVVLTVARDTSPGYVMAALLPHGIFELPALVIGEAAAFTFGVSVILSLSGKRNKETFLADTRTGLKFLLVSIILLIPGALIEAYVTPTLLGS
jgi:stage II sporulation protein M